MIEHHPALLALRSDIHTGAPCGVANVFLQPDCSDRIRDAKGKTVTGRARGVAVMLSGFDEPTCGLTVCEGCETGVALLMADLAPVWALGAAAISEVFPFLAASRR